MRRNFDQYKTHGQEPSIGVTSTHALKSRQKKSTRCLRLRPQSRAISYRAEEILVQQQPIRSVEKNRLKHIQYKNRITEIQIS